MPETLALLETRNWQSQLRDSIRSSSELLRLLHIEPTELDERLAAERDFPLLVPMAFAHRIRSGDPHDPLLLQVLASPEELKEPSGYLDDPLEETGEANPRPGIIHKYRGRVLVLVTQGCAINCRYCFRRHFPYGDNRNSRTELLASLDYVAQDPSIHEVILSGGDPLLASDPLLHSVTERLAAINHVKRLRIHSRLPIVLPDRITHSMLQAISHPRLQTVMVTHSNHAQELDHTVEAAVTRLRQYNITVLNQAVLLAGINDSTDTQVQHCEQLFARGILPYYLHVLDKVRGAAHFDLPEERARQLLTEMSHRLPGYLVPRLMREEPGARAKTWLGANSARQ